MTKVSVVIVTYNAIPYIDKCLNSVLQSDFLPEIIIVDNASTDHTVPYIRDNFKECTVLPQTINLGFGQANNLGIKVALNNNADYIFLLNQDVYIKQDTINTLLDGLCNNPEYGILSPIHLNGSGTALDFWFSKFISSNLQLVNTIQKREETQLVYTLPFVNAAAWMLSRELVMSIGGFDPMFFHYREDDNYCQRVIYHGYKIGVSTATSIRHDREHRKSQRPKPFSKKYFLNYDQNLKVRFGNINERINKRDIFSEKNKYLKKAFKALLRANIFSFIGFLKQRAVISKSLKEIKESRSTNSQKKANYLHLI